WLKPSHTCGAGPAGGGVVPAFPGVTGAVVAGSAASREDAERRRNERRAAGGPVPALQEADNDGREDEETVTVHLYSNSSRRVPQARCRDASLRICSSLLLLAVAIGFVLYELEYGDFADHSTQPTFYGLLGAPWNISTLESSSTITDSHNSHHHSEEEQHEDHQHGDIVHSHSAGTYHHAAAVTDSESCSQVARDVLGSDGSVVDAGIAAVLCLAVLHSHTVSLGGIFTSIYFNGTTQNASILNAIPSYASPIPYGIPTVLQGLWSLHQEHGRKLWSELFSPAVQLASQGFLVDNSLHAALEENQMKIMSSESLQRLFYNHTSLKSVGASIVNVQLGNVLEIARTMVNETLPDMLIQKLLNDIKFTDRVKFREILSMVHPKSSDPIRLHLDGLTLFSSSVPTAGGIFTSSVQEVYERHKNMSSATISEILINSSKIMYNAAGVWPPDIDDHSAEARREKDVAPAGSNVLVADSNGNVLVISLTLNSTFGSGSVSASTGILFSDFVQGAAVEASPNVSFWACPSVLLGSDNVVIGLAGTSGSSLPFSLAKVVLSQVLLQMDLPETISATMADYSPPDSDPWLRYFGLQGSAPETRMAIEVQAEHVHVVTAPNCSCHHAGL
ncbi:glutathione hydrolase 6, partial [Anomaloglossus baeobatrachus]|uniref:glutathione hydrolase 6 n=1 Tax=Anomaloglossus baeobatrachus TaxID=238106 RepID=UPI003F4F5244